MTESSHSYYPSPISPRVFNRDLGKLISNFWNQILGMRNSIKHTACEFHDAERMFKAAMCRSWIDRYESQLMNVPQPLERTGIQNLALVRIQADKYVDRITDFVNRLNHKKP